MCAFGVIEIVELPPNSDNLTPAGLCCFIGLMRAYVVDLMTSRNTKTPHTAYGQIGVDMTMRNGNLIWSFSKDHLAAI